MNEERLYINGQLVELSPNSKISLTRQVNDIASVDNRQAHFTRTIDIPKTPNNIKIFDYLGVVGNNSNVPYQKNTVNYFIDNDCLIFEGWAVINETSDDYKVNVYDGLIDFYKAIENRTFEDIDLTELNHQKDLPTITNSWSGDTPYTYILADYNGKATYLNESSGTTINTDYLIPSVNVPFLWDKIFDKYNSTYSGDIFENEDFTNLWMTFPKGVLSEGNSTLKYDSETTRFESFVDTFAGITSLYFFEQGNILNDLGTITSSRHFTPTNEGTYKIEITGRISPTGNDGSLAGIRCDLWLAKNSIGLTANEVTPVQLIKENIGGDYSTFYDLDSTINFNCLAGESFCLILRRNDGKNLRYVQESSSAPIKIKIFQIDEFDISFTNELKDFKIKDFINEIVWRFGLTIFKDKVINDYQFLTLSERVNYPEIDNQVLKHFIGVDSEKYIYSNYAQTNFFRYKYNDSENTHKDGSFNVENVNIAETKDVIKSSIYAPEFEPSFTLPIDIAQNTYKLWNKEVTEKDDGQQEIKYKSLDKRFYFLKKKQIIFAPLLLGSETLGATTTITTAPVESFDRLSFTEIVTNYYSDLSKILNKCKVITANFYLKPIDVANFDFRKLYYVEQLGAYFIVNKINGYQKNTITKVELIKVDFFPTYYGGDDE